MTGRDQNKVRLLSRGGRGTPGKDRAASKAARTSSARPANVLSPAQRELLSFVARLAALKDVRNIELANRDHVGLGNAGCQAYSTLSPGGGAQRPTAGKPFAPDHDGCLTHAAKPEAAFPPSWISARDEAHGVTGAAKGGDQNGPQETLRISQERP